MGGQDDSSVIDRLSPDAGGCAATRGKVESTSSQSEAARAVRLPRDRGAPSPRWPVTTMTVETLLARVGLQVSEIWLSAECPRCERDVSLAAMRRRETEHATEYVCSCGGVPIVAGAPAPGQWPAHDLDGELLGVARRLSIREPGKAVVEIPAAVPLPPSDPLADGSSATTTRQGRLASR